MDQRSKRLNYFRLEIKRDSNTKSQEQEYFLLNLDTAGIIQFLSYEKEYGEKDEERKLILSVNGHQYPFTEFTQESILRLKEYLNRTCLQ